MDSIIVSKASIIIVFLIGLHFIRMDNNKKKKPPSITTSSSENDSFSKIIINKNELKKTIKSIRFKHNLIPQAIEVNELNRVFQEGILKTYHEMQLPKYSRYENWKQSCYMQVHDRWNPKPEGGVNVALYKHMENIQEKCRLLFMEWYMELHNLEEVEVIVLNSFITKYVAEKGKNEFGKHVDGAKVDGSLVLALPTDEENDWPGMLVWDGAKGRGHKDPRPEHVYNMQPGDALVLDKLVWHHALPISKGKRFVVVNFYGCKWKKLKNSDNL